MAKKFGAHDIRRKGLQRTAGSACDRSAPLACPGDPLSVSPETLLREAVRACSIADIETLVQRGADVNARDEGGETALTWATGVELGAAKAEACVLYLLSLGARVSEESPAGGMGTSVHQAAEHGYAGALMALLRADGRVSLNCFDDMGRTPLICAVDNKRILEATVLLQAGADVNAHDSDKIGNSALSYAVMNDDLPMVQLLLAHGADPAAGGWMQLSAMDRARKRALKGSAPESTAIVELLEKEIERRK